VAGAVGGMGRVDKAPPRARPLLCLARQDQAVLAGCGGLVLETTGYVLFAAALRISAPACSGAHCSSTIKMP
jgi:hypothetical protein